MADAGKPTPDDQFRLRELSAEILRQAPVWVRSSPGRAQEYLADQLATELGRLAREGATWAVRIRDLHLERGVPAMLRDARLDQVIGESGRDLTPEEQARVMGVLLLGGSAADGTGMLDLEADPATSAENPTGPDARVGNSPIEESDPRGSNGDSGAGERPAG